MEETETTQMQWFEKLDFDTNPLVQETKTIGQEEALEEIFYAIASGNMLILNGQSGSGKTKLLKEVIRKFGGFGKVAYINCDTLNNDLNVEDIIIRRYGLIGRLLNKKPKNMVLLLDNVDSLSEMNSERIKYFYDQNYLRSVIFATKNPEALQFHESLMQRISKEIKVEPLSDYEATQLIKDKIGKNVLSDRVIKKIYHLSEKNIGTFLKNTEKICQDKVEKNEDMTEENVEKILGAEK